MSVLFYLVNNNTITKAEISDIWSKKRWTNLIRKKAEFLENMDIIAVFRHHKMTYNLYLARLRLKSFPPHLPTHYTKIEGFVVLEVFSIT